MTQLTLVDPKMGPLLVRNCRAVQNFPAPAFFFFFLCDCVIVDTFLISPYDFFNNWLPIQ